MSSPNDMDDNEINRSRISNPYGVHGSFICTLPFFKKLPIPPSTETEVPIIPSLIPEACGTKIITGGAIGAVMGVGLGLFMGAMGDVSPIQIVKGREVPQAPLREQTRAAFKAIGGKSIGWAKQFGVLTALFGGVECVIEKYRAKHDVWNPVLSGCVVGGTLGASGGPAVSNTYIIMHAIIS